jgi:hypothetical protein
MSNHTTRQEGQSAQAEDRLHPILSNAEVEAAKEKARKKIEADRRNEAMKAVEASEIERLKTEEGLVTGTSVNDEIVSVTIDLAEYADRITVNNTVYYHGHTYQVPRHVANSLAETCARAGRHQELEIDGKSLSQHSFKKRDTVISPRGSKGGTLPQSAA